MLPTLRIPFEDQLGMSEALHGARRSTLEQGLAHCFTQEVLGGNEESFVAVLNRFAAALGTLARPSDPRARTTTSVDRSEWSILQDLLQPGGRTQWDSADQQAVGEAWKSPLASLLATTLHCVGHAIAERAFLPGNADTGDAPAAVVDAADEHEADATPSATARDAVDEANADASTSVNADRVAQLHGVKPVPVLPMDLHQSFLRVRLGRALRYIATNKHRLTQASADGSTRLKIERPSYELFAQALLDALPDALGSSALCWIERTVRGKSQYALWISPSVRARLDSFIARTPMSFTLQPLRKCCQYGRRTENAAPDSAKPDHIREVPLLGFRRMNQPLDEFVELLQSSAFERFLPGIDAQQRVAWRLNSRILDCARKLADLVVEGDLPRTPVDGLTLQEVAAWRRWAGRELYRPKSAGGSNLAILPGEFLSNPLVQSVLEDAFVGGQPKPFFLPWKADYRGRIYAETPWLSPQGGDLQRALFEFAEGSVLEHAGWTALKRHGANLADRAHLLGDRVSEREVASLAEREEWVERHERMILECAEDPLRYPFWREMAKPWQFLAFCFAYSAGKLNKPCHTPVQVDGTCNGLQHIAALTGDHALAMEVNVCVEDADGATSKMSPPRDIYSRLAKDACKAFPAWIETARRNQQSNLHALDLLAATPRCFEDAAAAAVAVLSEGSLKASDAHKTLGACLPASNIKNLAKVLTGLLGKGKKDLKTSGLQNPTAKDLAVAAREACARDIAEISRRALGMDLLAAVPSAAVKRCPETSPCPACHWSPSPPGGGMARYHAYLDRGVAKAIVMTIPYGASAPSQGEKVAEVLSKRQDFDLSDEEIALLAACHAHRFRSLQGNVRPKFNASRMAAEVMAESVVLLMRSVIDESFASIKVFARTLNAVAGCAGPLPLLWETPLGLPVMQDGFRRDRKATKSVSLSPGNRTGINFVRLLDQVDPAAQQRKLLPNLIHSLDATHMMLCLQRLSDEGIDRFGSIHDCLLIHPNEALQAGAVVRDTFAKLYAREPGKVASVFEDWLAWMEMLHELAAFPNRTTNLTVPLKEILERLVPPRRTAAGGGSGSVVGSALHVAVRKTGATASTLRERALKLGFRRLAEFLLGLDQDTPERRLLIRKLELLVFLLQHAGVRRGKGIPRWPQATIKPDPRFDIGSVRQSAYFFS